MFRLGSQQYGIGIVKSTSQISDFWTLSGNRYLDFWAKAFREDCQGVYVSMVFPAGREHVQFHSVRIPGTLSWVILDFCLKGFQLSGKAAPFKGISTRGGKCCDEDRHTGYHGPTWGCCVIPEEVPRCDTWCTPRDILGCRVSQRTSWSLLPQR